MRLELTTAETLILETLVARGLLNELLPDRYGAITTFPRELWVKPQLIGLAELGYLTWRYDSEGDFEVTPAANLLDTPIGRAISRELGMDATDARAASSLQLAEASSRPPVS